MLRELLKTVSSIKDRGGTNSCSVPGSAEVGSVQIETDGGRSKLTNDR